MVHPLRVRDDLPTGTVTFLFTDIEGSTRLLDQLGPTAYADALAGHRRVVRETCSAFGGVEVDTQGDAFFLAFGRAPDAVVAARTITERLGDGPIRLRIGVCTGTALVTDEGYVGTDVHRAARIAAAGHGGQVLVGASTAVLTDDPLRDLGEHRFKDLAAPERVFQLGDRVFPPLKSLHRSNLPVPATPFLGREAELAAVTAMLATPGTRLVSLIGPGGTGKTRLAIQVAAEVSDTYPDGVYWASLATLRSAAFILPSVATAVGVSESPGALPVEDLARGLAGRRLLVFLDNAEHLMPTAADAIGDLTRACPTVTVIVTSRERLQLPGERVYAVPPMSASDGERLFRSRAAEAGVVIEASDALRSLCARLDDLPLALELAAARTVVFSPEQLLERVSQRLDLFKAGRGVDARQATLRATIAWSHDLLDSDEQALFRRFSVFVGGSTVEAAEAITGVDVDVLQSLFDKSLLRRADGIDGPRFRMLETIREFAAEQLVASGEADELTRRHLNHHAALLDECFDKTLRGHDDLDRIGAERDNLRRALDVAQRTEPGLALEMAPRLARYWVHSGSLREGRERIATALSGAPDGAPAWRALAHYGAGLLAWYQSDLGAIEPHARKAFELYQEIGDQRGAGCALGLLAWIPLMRGDDDMSGSRSLFEAATAAFVEAGDEELRLKTLGFLALAIDRDGDHEGALALLREVVAGLRREGSPHDLATALINLTGAEERAGHASQARRSLEESLDLYRRIDSSYGVAGSLLQLGHLLQESDPAVALEHYTESLRLSREREDQRGIGYCLLGGAAIFSAQGDAARALTLLGGARRTFGEIGISLDPEDQLQADAIESRCRASLSSEEYSRAWEEGTALDTMAAADWALRSWEQPGTTSDW